MNNDILLRIINKDEKEKNNITDEVDDIIEGIDEISTPKELPPVMNLSSDDLESFIRNNAGQLVTEGLDYVRQLKAERGTNISSKEMESIAELIKATSSAIESLNKLSVVHLKHKNEQELKQLEMKSNESDKITITREQLFEMAVKMNQQKKEIQQLTKNNTIDISNE